MNQKSRQASLLAILLLVSALPALAAQRTLSGVVPPVVAKLVANGRPTATSDLSIDIGLPLRNPAELDGFIHQLYDPASTNFHKFVTPPEFAERFGPTEADYEDIIHFARTNGLSVSETFTNRLVLSVRGKVTDIERAFQVTLRTYRHPAEARDFYAPDREPSVPASLRLLSVEGLDDYNRPRHLAKKRTATQASPLSFNGTGPGNQYAGRDFRNAYVPGTALDGTGQKVALLEYSDYFRVDITNYANIVGAVIGVTNYVPLLNVVVNGTVPATTDNGEVALDIEMAMAMAPMLSQIIVYEKNTVSSTLMNRIATDNLAKQVSSSWSVGNWNSSTATTYDNILKNMAAQGQSFFQASGDSDAYTGSHPLDSGITVPVDSPYLTAVGGSTLTMNGGGTSWNSETVWNYNLSGIPNLGSGGGISAFYARPSWQTNISMANNSGSITFRNIPDVAMTADNLFVVYNNGDASGNSYFMGTSAAAPLWAGFCALVNQQSVAVNGTTVGFLNPALYALAGSPSYPTFFHDITTGNNIGTNTAGLFNAVAGYDLATGLGTPNGTNLINALAPTLPLFLTQAAGRTVTNGATVSLSATVLGASPLSFQWLFNGTNLPGGGAISGVNTNALSITAVTTNNAGNYKLVVTNIYGAITSSVAVLTVGLVPAMVTQPTNLTVLAGGVAAFSATVNGSTPFGFQWKKGGTNLVNGAGIAGATTNSLTLTGITTNSAGNYTLAITNAFGATTSSVATLTVVLPPSIANSAVTNRIVECGGNVAYSVVSGGTTPLGIQWSVDGAAVFNATNTTFTFTNVHQPNHTVAVVVTNLYASITSNAVLTVADTLGPVIALNGLAVMTNELGTSFVDPGATASDACAGAVPVTTNGAVNTAAVSTNLLTYRATDGNGNTNSATRTVIIRDTTAPVISFSFTNLILAANGSCSALMTNVTGTNFILTSDLSGAVVITQSPTNNAVLPLGTNLVVITVADASGNTAFSTNYVVVQDQTPPVIALNGGGVLTNELGAAFVDPGVMAGDACAGVAALMTNGVVNVGTAGTNTLSYVAVDGSGNSNSVLRTVIVRDTAPPTITWSFTNLVLAAGTNCDAVMPDVTGTNYVLATDLSGPLTVAQMPTNGTVLSIGTNEVVITVLDAFSNTAFSTNSIIVQDQAPPSLLAQPESRTNDVGTTASFSVTATACTPVTFLWFSNNVVLVQQTNMTLTLANVSPAAAGNYFAVASAAGGSVTSLVATLTVNIPPGIANVAANFDGSFTLNLLGMPGYTYVLEASTNLGGLNGWVPVATNTLGTNGLWQFTDPQATNYLQQFYRLKLGP